MAGRPPSVPPPGATTSKSFQPRTLPEPERPADAPPPPTRPLPGFAQTINLSADESLEYVHKRIGNMKVYKYVSADNARPSDLTRGGDRVDDLTPEQAMTELVHIATEANKTPDRLAALKLICQIKGMLKYPELEERSEPLMIVDEEGKKLFELTRARKTRLQNIADKAKGAA